MYAKALRLQIRIGVTQAIEAMFEEHRGSVGFLSCMYKMVSKIDSIERLIRYAQMRPITEKLVMN